LVNFDSKFVPNDNPDRAPIIAPPPLIAVICILVGFLAKHFISPLTMFATMSNFQIGAGAAMVVFAIVIVGLCRRAFIQHGTHPNPYTPTKAIVISGVYGFSRNPIYMAFLVIVVAFALFANSWWFIGSAALGFILLHLGAVKREEKYLPNMPIIADESGDGFERLIFPHWFPARAILKNRSQGIAVARF
jgi:protein-S-isoprenylcysteine O-methyltransferase Ste14